MAFKQCWWFVFRGYCRYFEMYGADAIMMQFGTIYVVTHWVPSMGNSHPGTTVSLRRAEHKLVWRLSCDCRHQAAFTDASWQCYYARMQFVKFRVTNVDDLATIICASAHSVTPHGGLTPLQNNPATAIIGAQWHSADPSGGLNLMILYTFMTGFKHTM